MSDNSGESVDVGFPDLDSRVKCRYCGEITSLEKIFTKGCPGCDGCPECGKDDFDMVEEDGN